MKNKVLTEIDHPKIVSLKCTYKSDSHIGLTLGLAKGMGLSDLLHSYHKLPEELIRIIVWQLIDIFEFMHKENYIYKDLKASHIFLNKTGKITLIDFGMVEKIEQNAKSFVPAGTFHWMSPEIIDLWESSIQNDGKVDQEAVSGYDTSADLYSIGVLIYELMLGHPPFGYLQATATTEDRLEYFAKTRKGLEFFELYEIIADKLGKDLNQLQTDLIDLMKKLLNQSPDKRPPISKSSSE